MVRTIELLADELKKLAGWGAHPHRLATKPVLSGLAGVHEDLTRTTAGSIVGRYLVEAIRSMEGAYAFLDREYDAHTLGRALRIELGIERGSFSAPARQYLTTQILGLDCSYDQWRKHHRYQRALFVILAEHCVRNLQLA